METEDMLDILEKILQEEHSLSVRESQWVAGLLLCNKITDEYLPPQPIHLIRNSMDTPFFTQHGEVVQDFVTIAKETMKFCKKTYPGAYNAIIKYREEVNQPAKEVFF